MEEEEDLRHLLQRHRQVEERAAAVEEEERTMARRAMAAPRRTVRALEGEEKLWRERYDQDHSNTGETKKQNFNHSEIIY